MCNKVAFDFMIHYIISLIQELLQRSIEQNNMLNVNVLTHEWNTTLKCSVFLTLYVYFIVLILLLLAL